MCQSNVAIIRCQRHRQFPSTHNTPLAGYPAGPTPHVQAPERESSVTHDSASQVRQKPPSPMLCRLCMQRTCSGMEATRTHATQCSSMTPLTSRGRLAGPPGTSGNRLFGWQDVTGTPSPTPGDAWPPTIARTLQQCLLENLFLSSSARLR